MKYRDYLVALNLIVAAGLLAACAANTAGTTVASSVSPAVLAGLQATCAKAAPLIAIGSAPSAPSQVSGITTYAQAFCSQLASGVTPATADANSQSWLNGVLNAAQIAAQVAGIAMPLIALF